VLEDIDRIKVSHSIISSFFCSVSRSILISSTSRLTRAIFSSNVSGLDTISCLEVRYNCFFRLATRVSEKSSQLCPGEGYLHIQRQHVHRRISDEQFQLRNLVFQCLRHRRRRWMSLLTAGKGVTATVEMSSNRS
jgi:hypothetical protein